MRRALFLGIMGTLVRDTLPTLRKLLRDGLSAASSLACLPPFPPEALCPLLVSLEPTHTISITELSTLLQSSLRIILPTWSGQNSKIPCLFAWLHSHPPRKARNRLLFAVPSARLVETWSLPKIGCVNLCWGLGSWTGVDMGRKGFQPAGSSNLGKLGWHVVESRHSTDDETGTPALSDLPEFT